MVNFVAPPVVGSTPPIQTSPLWQWDTSGQVAVVTGYPNAAGVYGPTKTGLLPQDLQSFIGVPLQYYGNPPSGIPQQVIASGDVMNFIRYAEDWVEQQTSILLCQTWVASPPTANGIVSNNAGIIVNSPNGAQTQGFDYDLADAGYDFMFNRAQDSGWMYQTLRYRPVQSLGYCISGSGAGFGINSCATIGATAVKSISFVYPLLNVFTKIPPQWIVEDRNFGLVRLVPATDVQMLPLYSMQLTFMGFSEDVPGAQYYQYTAGLTDFDYKNKFAFMKQLVLAEASIIALNVMQGTISLGAESYRTLIDGLQWNVTYPKSGPYGPLIDAFGKRRDFLMKVAMNLVAGPTINVL